MSTFIQSKGNGSTGSATTLAVTMPNATRTGNSLLVFFIGQTASPTSVTDGTNTYTRDLNSTISGVAPFMAFRSDNIVGSAGHVITANFIVDTLPRNMIVVEHRGLTSSSFDTSNTASNSGNSNTSPLVSGTLTPGQNVELLVGLYGAFNGNVTGTPIRGFEHSTNEATGSANFRIGYCDQVINGTNGQTTGFTWSTGGISVGVMALSYKIAFVGAVTPNRLRPAVFSPGLAR